MDETICSGNIHECMLMTLSGGVVGDDQWPDDDFESCDGVEDEYYD